MLFYRKDLFYDAGLAEPKTYADVEKAASTLNKDKMAGIVAATAPADSFTVQTFEWTAQANGCQLVDDAGNVTLNTPACEEAFRFYGDMMRTSSVKGNQDADTTRATYFAGDAAMTIWSSFLLDELAGLRNDAQPTCDQCKDDPKWLAENTGIVTTLQGPSGTAPVAFGEIVSWAVLPEASDKTKDMVSYMMSDGYLEWLGIAPEGKVPTRTGTAENPKEYADGWAKLEAGVDTKELLSANYPPEVLAAVAASPDSFERWGLPQGQGALAGAVAGQFVVPQALAKMINSGASAADAAGAEATEDALSRSRPISAGRGQLFTRRRPCCHCGANSKRRTLTQRDARLGLRLMSPTLMIVVTIVVLPLLWSILLSFQRLRLINVGRASLFEPLTLANYQRVLGSDVLLDQPGRPRSSTRSARSSSPSVSACWPRWRLGIRSGAAPSSGRRSCCPMSRRSWPSPSSGGPCSTRSSASSTQFGQAVLGWDEPIAFLSQATGTWNLFGLEIPVPTALLTTIVFEGWRYFPFAFLFLMARLEACRVSRRRPPWSTAPPRGRRFRHIVFPQLVPIIGLLAVLRTIWTFNEFDDIFLLTGGARRHRRGQRADLQLPHRATQRRSGRGAVGDHVAGAGRDARRLSADPAPEGGEGMTTDIAAPPSTEAARPRSRRPAAAARTRDRRAAPRLRHPALGGDRGLPDRHPGALLLHGCCSA